MIIRRANVDDCYSVAKLLTLCWKKTYKGLISQRFLNQMSEKMWLERLRKQIEGKQTTLLVAEQDDDIIGMIGCGASRWDSDANWGEIYSLYVHPDYQKQSIGKQLVEMAQNEVFLQYAYIKVLAMSGNDKAINFYKKVGFTLTSQIIDSQIDGKVYHNVVFERKCQTVGSCV